MIVISTENGGIRAEKARSTITMKLTSKQKKPPPLSRKDFRQKKKFDSFRYSRIKTIELIWQQLIKMIRFHRVSKGFT